MHIRLQKGGIQMRKRFSLIMAAVLCAAAVGLLGSSVQAASAKKTAANGSAGKPSDSVYTAVVTAEHGLNLRKTMDTDSKGNPTGTKLVAVPNKQVVSILDREAKGWYKVQFKYGKTIYTGYMKGKTYLADNPNVMAVNAGDGKALRLRAKASTADSSKVLAKMTDGSAVEVIEKVSSDWYYVNYEGEIGYAAAKYLKKAGTTSKTIDLKDVEFDDITVYFDTKEHALPKVENLPDGVKVTYSSTAKYKDIGAYTVKASFKATKAGVKLVNAEDRTASLSIRVKDGAVYRTRTLRLKVTNPNIRGKGTVMITGPVEKTMTEVNIPKSIKIGGVSFSVTAIYKKAFYKNTSLKEAVIPDDVTTIGSYAFYKCTKLREVSMGTGLKQIGKKAFYGDKKLMSIVIKSKKLTKIGSKAFKKVPEDVEINVPNSKVSSYKKLFAGKGLQSTSVIE